MTENKGTSCPISKRNEPEIKALTDMINKTGGILQKIKYAEELLKKADEQLACQQFNKDDSFCINCRTVSSLQKETAELIIKMKKLT